MILGTAARRGDRRGRDNYRLIDRVEVNPQTPCLLLFHYIVGLVVSPSDPVARREQLAIWTAHQPLAKALVREKCAFNPSIAKDALQEVQLALWEATLERDVELGDAFAAFAHKRMSRRLIHFLRYLVEDKPKLSSRERELIKAIRTRVRAGTALNTLIINELSQEHGVGMFRIVVLLNTWVHNMSAYTADAHATLDRLSSEEPDFDVDDEHQLLELELALAKLNERELEIIQGRYLQDPNSTLAELAARFSITPQRVRQIEVAAIGKLRSLLPAG